jgi:hypothetical protein
MGFRSVFCLLFLTVIAGSTVHAQVSSSTTSASHQNNVRKRASPAASHLDAGVVSNGVYRNAMLGFSCKIPAAWVLRTEEMNTREQDTNVSTAQDPGQQSAADDPPKGSEPPRARRSTKESEGGGPAKDSSGLVLLVAFSRPPEARAEDVNASVLIAAESVAAYPGLKDAAQYFGPVSEVAKAQGFKVVNEPYNFIVGTKTAVREDFQKDVGTRVMRQATLVTLARGYAVSVTFIGGTEEEVEELVQGLSFLGARPK